MKLLFLSDTHIRERSPVGRIDNFRESQWKKWHYICKTAKENDVHGIIQAGDLFDNPTPSYSLVSEFLNIITTWKIPIYYI